MSLISCRVIFLRGLDLHHFSERYCHPYAPRPGRHLPVVLRVTVLKKGYNYVYDLGELGRAYSRYRHLMEHWQRILPQDRILDVQYEDVITDLEGQARRILAHCSLPWDDKCLDFYRTQRPVRTASRTQVRQPVYTSAIGRWQGYEELLTPLLVELGVGADRKS